MTEYVIDVQKGELIVIYMVAGHDQKMRGMDLRGATWEPLFELSERIVVEHVSDGPLTVNGVTFTVLPEGSKAYRDVWNRKITKECWKHFLRYHPNSRWFLRGLHDVFVNVTNLLDEIHHLERQYDPFSQWVARYGCHRFMGLDCPHGSTGHMYSNRAVRMLVDNIEVFDRCKRGTYEDVCTRTTIDALNQSFYNGCSSRFIIQLPDIHDSDIRALVRRRTDYVCAAWQNHGAVSEIRVGPSQVSSAITIHMHKLKMEDWASILHSERHLWVTWVRSEHSVGARLCQVM
jgi:hypothetical protein